jgi:cytidine deaminase
VGHAERIIAKELESTGIEPAQVSRIYSELEPCVAPGGYCKPFLSERFPNASISYSFEYGDTQASRAAGVDALRRSLTRIFGGG